MTVRDFARIHELRELCAKEYEIVVTAHEQATKITVALSGMPRGGSVGSMIENAVIRADTHLAIYTKLCKELNILLTKLRQQATKKLNEDDCHIICWYYIDQKKLTEIAKMLSISERHVYRRRKEAIAILTRTN